MNDHRLVLTAHPLQRCGVRAIAALAGRSHPAEVSPADMHEVTTAIIADLAGAGTAAKGTAMYDWWKVLFALYPNSKPTHASRPREAGLLQASITSMLMGDPGPRTFPCTFCLQPCDVVWGKENLPLFDTLKRINSLPPRMAGWPVCLPCRVAMWALPYGAWVTLGSATVLTSRGDDVEQEFTIRNAERAKRIQQAGMSSLAADASPETVTLEALRVHAARAPADATLWLFKNDNQDPWLRVATTRSGVTAFMRRMLADADCSAGWYALGSALTIVDGDGKVTESGAPKVAKTMFDPAGQPGDRLPEQLLIQVRKTVNLTSARAHAWRALFCLYMEVMHEMDTGQVRPARDLLVSWITQETNPRGRFNEYVGAAMSPYKLNALLMRASARLLLDGHRPPAVADLAPALLADSGPGRDGWRQRGLLFFDVIAELVASGARIGQKDSSEDEDDDVVSALEPSDDTESEAYA